MKITLATALLLCASVAFVKADWGYTDLEEEDEIETLEDELSELEPWETEDPAIAPPKPLARLEVSTKLHFLTVILQFLLLRKIKMLLTSR